jgi:hypothetical protein
MPHHRRYQPERADILWNSDWGLPREDLDKDQARADGLVLWEGRWITKDDRKLLRSQYHAYRIVRYICGRLVFVSCYSILMPVLLFVRMRSVDLPIPEGGQGFLLLYLLSGILQVLVA